jgi:hypothetical protein
MKATLAKETDGPFVTEIHELRGRARHRMEMYAVSSRYSVGRETVMRGIHARTVTQEFLEHAREEQAHPKPFSNPLQPMVF